MTEVEQEIDWPPLIELADKVAWEITNKWSVVEADDVKQEILLHAMTEKKVILKFQDNEEMLRSIFWTSGKRYAARERAHFDLMDDQYYYTPEETRMALRSFLYTDEELGDIMGKEDDLIRCRVDDNLVSARMDASSSMKKLNKRYQEVVYKRFVYGLPAKDDNERRMAYRAVDALTAAMNRTLRTRNKAGD